VYEQPTHHTCPSEHRVMDRVGCYAAIAIYELYPDDNEIVNMLQVVSDALFRVLWIATSNDKIASCTNADLVGNMTRKNKLTIMPPDIDLNEQLDRDLRRKQKLT
jgi:hypothetical protein